MPERQAEQPETAPKTLFEQQWNQEAERFIDDHKLSKNSRSAYANDISQCRNYMMEHGVTDWPDITPQLMEDFTKDQEIWCSPHTAYRRLAVLDGFFTWIMVETNYKLSKRTEETTKSLRKEGGYLRLKLVPDTVSKEDYSTLIKKTNLRDTALILLLGNGLSPQTLRKLRVGYVTSGELFRAVSLDNKTSTALSDYLQVEREEDLDNPASPLFKRHNRLGDPVGKEALTRGGIWYILNRISAKADIKCTPGRLNKSAKSLHGPLN